MWENHFNRTCTIQHYKGTSKTNTPSYSPPINMNCNIGTKWVKETKDNVTTVVETVVYRIPLENLTINDKVDSKLIKSIVPYYDFDDEFSHVEVITDA